MIDFSTGDELDLVAETASRFADAQIAPRLRELELAGGVPAALAAEARDIGFDRIDWPEACGGAQMGAVGRAIALEQLAGACPGATLALLPMGSVAQALLAFGGEAALRDQAERLADLPGGRAVLVFDHRGALRQEAGRLDGVLPWVPAGRVDLLAVLSSDGLRLVTDGVEATSVPGSGLRAAGASELRLTQAPIAASWTDPAAAAIALAQARLHVAALMVGQMHAAAEFSRQYALERVAFGKPIAHHQALAFLIVDMHAAVATTRQLVREAAWRLDAGVPAASAAAAAFIEAAETGLFIGSNAVQILGAAGFMRDYPVEKQMRELRALGLLLGGADAARDDALGCGPAAALEPFLVTTTSQD